jgi:hypothetical protein
MNNNAAIPVGFRFHPTDEELVGYYLHGKVTRNQQDQIILELDLYKIEPWDLHGKQACMHPSIILEEAATITTSTSTTSFW